MVRKALYCLWAAETVVERPKARLSRCWGCSITVEEGIMIGETLDKDTPKNDNTYAQELSLNML